MRKLVALAAIGAASVASPALAQQAAPTISYDLAGYTTASRTPFTAFLTVSTAPNPAESGGSQYQYDGSIAFSLSGSSPALADASLYVFPDSNQYSINSSIFFTQISAQNGSTRPPLGNVNLGLYQRSSYAPQPFDDGIPITITSWTQRVTSAVPEPATWAMMLIGFGAIGYGMRRDSDLTARIRTA